MAVVQLHEQRMADMEELYEAAQVRMELADVYERNQKVANELAYTDIATNDKLRIIAMIPIKGKA